MGQPASHEWAGKCDVTPRLAGKCDVVTVGGEA